MGINKNAKGRSRRNLLLRENVSLPTSLILQGFLDWETLTDHQLWLEDLSCMAQIISTIQGWGSDHKTQLTLILLELTSHRLWDRFHLSWATHLTLSGRQTCLPHFSPDAITCSNRQKKVQQGHLLIRLLAASKPQAILSDASETLICNKAWTLIARFLSIV